MRLLVLVVLITGCTEHGRHPMDDGGGIDIGFGLPDAADPLCGFVQCGAGRHCEAQCAPGDGCPNECHVTCVPAMGCASIACGPGTTCVETSTYDCAGMAWLASNTCPAIDPTSCEQQADEAACTARPGCTPVFRGAGCGCQGDLCSCMAPKAEYLRCRTR